MHAFPRIHHIDPRALLAAALALAVAMLLAVAPSLPDVSTGGGSESTRPAATDRLPVTLTPTPDVGFSFGDPLASPLAQLERPVAPR